MTTVYLHVGMPKCASSSLQAFFHHNDSQHRALGLCYPRTCRQPTGYFSHRPLHDLPPEGVPNAVREIAAEARAAGCEKILLSSEEFSNSRWDREITSHIIEALNAEFGLKNVRLVFLFRNHFSFVESVFAQFLKGGMFRVPAHGFFKRGNTDILAYTRSFRNRNGFHFFSYNSMVNRFRVHAPKNGFEVYSIEPPDLGGRDIIEVLCAKLGVPYENPRSPSNTRFSQKALLGLRYSRAKYGFHETRTERNKINKLLAHDQPEFSPIIQVSDPLFMMIKRAMREDQGLFRTLAKSEYKTLFSVPDKYRRQRKQTATVSLSEDDMAGIDKIIKRATTKVL